MRTWLASFVSRGCGLVQTRASIAASVIAVVILGASAALAQPAPEVGGEASLKLPDLSSVSFLGMDGHKLLMIGILFCIARTGLRHGDLYAAEESAGTSRHAGDFRTDL